MKGYSFQELVNLAEAAVKRAGDTMTGNLTVPAVNLSASQSSAPNTVTRKDYVDGEIAKRVAKTGDTMTGNLTAPKVLVSGAQGTESNALTRKDYVDAELAKKLTLTGGTLTGNLTAPAVIVSSAQDTSVNALTRKDYVDSAIAAGDALQVSKTGDTMTGNLTAPKVLVSGAQGTEINALTRKDYVDAELAKKLNLAGGTLTGNLTAPAVLVSSTQNTSVNALTRKDYVDSAIAAGDALQVSKTGDTMTGNLTAPKVLVSSTQGTESNALTRKDYVDAELSKKLGLTGGTMTGALYINHALNSRSITVNDISSGANLVITPQGSNERFTIDMYPTSGAAYQVMEFRGSDRTTSFKQIVSCDSAPVAATHLTRKDYVDEQVATRAPTTHNHTAAQGNSDIVAGGYGQIGTYALLRSLSNSNLGPGSTLEGSSLQYVSCSGKDNFSAPSPGGTWKCLGIANSYKNAEGSGATLWVRIA